MTLTTFIMMGVVLALCFVAALFAVFHLNRQDRLDSHSVSMTGQPGAYYGRQPYAQQTQGQYAQQTQGQYAQQQPYAPEQGHAPQQGQPQPGQGHEAPAGPQHPQQQYGQSTDQSQQQYGQ